MTETARPPTNVRRGQRVRVLTFGNDNAELDPEFPFSELCDMLSQWAQTMTTREVVAVAGFNVNCQWIDTSTAGEQSAVPGPCHAAVTVVAR
jgi:hypothetical protein